MSPVRDPEQSGELLLWLALLELGRARSLAAILPGPISFEAHANTGLEIGTCGRRIEILLSSRLYKESREWQGEIPILAEINDLDFAPTYGLYHLLHNVAIRNYPGAYDLIFALGQCLATLKAEPDSTVGEDLLPSIFDNAAKVVATYRARTTQKPKIARVCRGPITKEHDGRWKFAKFNEPLTRMLRIEYEKGLLQKLHHTAFRETVASEIVGLNILEYDGLPWGFYLDMTRQCEDEARHSLMASDELHRRGQDLTSFKLPYLRSYYEMFWDMSLTERLVALNLDIEAVGAPHLGDMARRMASIGDVSAAHLFSCLHHDEKRHARIGAIWLKYLYPSVSARRSAVDSCRALTCVNLASASARLTGEPFWQTLIRWAGGDPIYVYDEPFTEEHEREVTPLLARVKGNVSEHAIGLLD